MKNSWHSDHRTYQRHRWHSVQTDLCWGYQEKLLQPFLVAFENWGWAGFWGVDVGIITDARVTVVGAVVVVEAIVVVGEAVASLAAAGGEDHRCHHHVKTLQANCFYLEWNSAQDNTEEDFFLKVKKHYRWGWWNSVSEWEGGLERCEWSFEALQKAWH